MHVCYDGRQLGEPISLLFYHTVTGSLVVEQWARSPLSINFQISWASELTLRVNKFVILFIIFLHSLSDFNILNNKI